jgi:hypothetical protein
VVVTSWSVANAECYRGRYRIVLAERQLPVSTSHSIEIGELRFLVYDATQVPRAKSPLLLGCVR